jgi:hypothetical protein
MKSGSLILLEPSGPHRSCYWAALPLPVHNTLSLQLQETQIVLTQLTGCNFKDRFKLAKLCIRNVSTAAKVSHYAIKLFLAFSTKVRRIDVILIKQAPGTLRAN